MFVVLSKILPLFVYPLGLITILLLLAVLLKRQPRRQNVVLLMALLLIFVTGNSWVPQVLARSLERQYMPLKAVPHAQAIVVLGGSTETPVSPRSMVEVNGAADRLIYAARLYHQGSAPVILVSGGSINWLDSRTISAAEEMVVVLGWLGVPEEDIWLQTESRNTYEDALYSTQILVEQDVEHILLVTSAMHMPRSVALFEKQGLEITPAPTDYSLTDADWENLTSPNLGTQIIHLLPNIGNVGTTTAVLKEYLGMLVYRLRGWM
jgi:uncharacterized SAM-binding protein YcdF (DUF218 family)